MPSNTLGTFYRPQSPTMNAGGMQRPMAPRAAGPMFAGPQQPRPMNPAAPRQFGAFGGPRPQMAAPRPAVPMMAQSRPAPPRPVAPRAPAPRQQMMGANMGAAMMSDERSKKRIAELENLNEQYSALLDTPSATAGVRPKAPPTADLDRSNARALADAGSYSYEYKNPGAAGAATGRHAGPMAQELEGIPGVVRPGPDGLKRVDTGRLALATASATGDQERRLRALEELNQDYDALSDSEQLYRDLDEGEQRSLEQIRRASSQGAFSDGDARTMARSLGAR